MELELVNVRDELIESKKMHRFQIEENADLIEENKVPTSLLFSSLLFKIVDASSCSQSTRLVISCSALATLITSTLCLQR
jgi:hypothetical protein